MSRLGVNIDHVATLRQARGEEYPSLSRAARECLFADADQITIHLREDRRHIQDRDLKPVQAVCLEHEKDLNLEVGATEEMLAIALDLKAQWVCLVPENRMERTTEGGLNLTRADVFKRIQSFCTRYYEMNPEGKISLFVEAEDRIMSQVAKLKVDAVEIHTGEYANCFKNLELREACLEKFLRGQKDSQELGIRYHAGHGLTLENLHWLHTRCAFEEYNIGHWIVAEALFHGLGATVKEVAKVIRG